MLTSSLSLSQEAIVEVPGDKSISHRSVLFSALTKGKSKISGFLEAEDPLNTMRCFAKLGVKVEKVAPGEYTLESPGKDGLHSTDGLELDFGNGGTGIRLSAGLLAGLPGISCILTGDASLRKRPMGRITEPLAKMGASITAIGNNDKAPLRLQGKKLQDFSYKSTIASAQVKSCLALAAISSGSALEYQEPELSRDHTENMIRFLGGKVESISGSTHFKLTPPYDWHASEFRVPGDISSAAFFLVMGCLLKKGSICVKNVGLNPARSGVLQVLRGMGGNIAILNEREECGEKVGDIKASASELNFFTIPAKLIPSLIDEVPILTIAGLFAKGGFAIRNAKELRVKESDRIHAMVKNLEKLGVSVEEFPDGYSFSQVESIQAGEIESFMDHRIAMSFSVLSNLCKTPIRIDDESWIDTSFPDFKKIMQRIQKYQ
ncbi:MAG: 3-phosphoshikimate 1-carboxyvinyltransferase [Spirochaetota bacterium]